MIFIFKALARLDLITLAVLSHFAFTIRAAKIQIKNEILVEAEQPQCNKIGMRAEDVTSNAQNTVKAVERKRQPQ